MINTAASLVEKLQAGFTPGTVRAEDEFVNGQRVQRQIGMNQIPDAWLKIMNFQQPGAWNTDIFDKLDEDEAAMLNQLMAAQERINRQRALQREAGGPVARVGAGY